MRAAVLLADDIGAREELHGLLVTLAGGDAGGPAAADSARRALVAALRAGDRGELQHDLDRELLGLSRRPALRAAV